MGQSVEVELALFVAALGFLLGVVEGELVLGHVGGQVLIAGAPIISAAPSL